MTNSYLIIMKKICNCCKQTKEVFEFSKHKGKKDGYSSNCLICLRVKNKKYRDKNKDKELQRVNKFLSDNPNYHKNYMKSYSHLKRDFDPIYKLKHNIRVRISKFLKSKNIKKTNKTFSIVGCSPEYLKFHIENKFTVGMSWDKFGKEIHIDHIIPLSSAKTEEDIYKLCHYTNLQPLWSVDNLKKSNKLI